ncbi:MAG: hypothetical protein IPL83_05805 [Bdellovibrionales bacterium]|nr:hypothetical protein [Bdellovibrionales bacterium]
MRAISRNLHRAHEEIDTEGTWAISYGDMVTLLLSFFVLYFTVDQKADQAQHLQDSLMASLKSLSEEDKPIDKSSYKLHIGEEKSTEIDQKIIDRLGAKVHQVGQKIVIEFPGVSFFDIGKIDLRSDGVRMLSEFVTAYLPFAGKYSLGVHSFTDTRQVLRTKNRRFNDNLELSALRSVAAMRVLQSRGIPLHAMRISGLGELEVTSEQLKASGVNLLSGDPRDLARKVVLVVEPAVERGGKG